MVKAVFDTSVLISALLTPNGRSRSLVERALAKEFELFLSKEILAESQNRLCTHQRLRMRYGYTDEEVAYFISRLRSCRTRKQSS
ncbi:MAG: putative toxin-antitoxin system toxin component, PIN family [Blastocatellia bacterium]